MDKTTKIEIIVIIILTIILAFCVSITVKEINNINAIGRGERNFGQMGMPMDEEVERVTKAEDVKANISTSENDIDLFLVNLSMHLLLMLMVKLYLI